MAKQRAQAGSPLRISAGDYNNACDAGQWFAQQQALGRGGSGTSAPINPCTVIIRNDSGGDLPQGAVVQIGDSPLTTLDRRHLWFTADEPSTTTGCYGVLLQPVLNGKYGEAQVSGTCLALADVDDTSHTHVAVVSGQTKFQSGAEGWARLVNAGSTGDDQLVPVLLRGSGSSIPFVYLTDPGRLLNSGSGSPGTMQISAARWGAVYFKKSYNDPAAAGIEVLTEDAASVSDPAVRFVQDGFYRVSIRWTGQDDSSYGETDYRFQQTFGSNTYTLIDQFHHAFPRCFVNFNEETGDGWPEIITSVSGSVENFGGYTNYGGGDPPTSSLTQMHWGESSRQASGFFYRNFTAGNELRFSMTYYKASGIVSTAVLFKINSFDVEIARIGDQVTEATYTL